ncbi:Uncharacterised protein [Mycobacterium tuberculosis]|nr:Uncharacterised protein [Mycobacterium tuberculosis]
MYWYLLQDILALVVSKSMLQMNMLRKYGMQLWMQEKNMASNQSDWEQEILYAWKWDSAYMAMISMIALHR